MANYIKNLGVEFLTETEDAAIELVSIVAQEGVPIVGYYGEPYFNMHFGNAQFIARSEIEPEEKQIRITGLDTHSAGDCIWQALISKVAVNPKERERTQRRCMLKRKEDGAGMAIVNILNADVLPSFLENDEISLQMVAFPTLIEYYRDEDDYVKQQPEGRNGKKWLLSEGMILPTGFMKNHDPESPDFEKNMEIDDLHLIRGKVKAAYWGAVKLGDETYNSYIRCIIETQFGELELVHTPEQVLEEQRKYIKPGCVVNGLFVLSGDAAIDEYAKGLIRDEEHNLRALRYTFEKGEADRLWYILSEDAVYISDISGEEYYGRKAIIERMQFIHENSEKECVAQMAEITSVDEKDGLPPYMVGKRCVVLSRENTENFIIAFIELNVENRISKLHTSTDERYHFKCNGVLRFENSFQDIAPIKDVSELILMRARFHGIIGDDMTDEWVMKLMGNCFEYKRNAEQMLKALKENPQSDVEAAFKNIFGYLFAKAIECAEFEARKNIPPKPSLIASYVPQDALKDTIRTELGGDEQRKIQEAMALGKQFYKDFKFFIVNGEPNDELFNATIIRALILVQRLGEVYSSKCLAQ